MKIIAMAALLALAAPLCAADAKPKSRTLKEVVDLAVREGKEATLDAAMAEKLGFGRVVLAEKRLRFKKSISPDQKEHNFRVVLKDGKPLALDISSVSGGKVGDKIFTDGMVFRATLSGKLEKAVHNKGYAGEIQPEELSIKSADVKKQFQAELDFHQHQAVSLGLPFDK